MFIIIILLLLFIYLFIIKFNSGISFTFLTPKQINDPKSNFDNLYYSVQQPIISLACHDESGQLAVGHETGQLSILSNIPNYLQHYYQNRYINHNLIAIAIQHWHAHSGKTMII
jgi:hypothetical protein